MRAALTFAALVIALPAGAASGEESGRNELLWQVLNLALLLGILFAVARKPVRAFFADRRASISGNLDSAAEVLKEAEQRYAEWQRKLAEVGSELETIRSESRERADEEKQQILAEAQRSAERIRQDALAAVEQELRRAKGELREEASRLAIELAGDLLREEVNESDRDRLMDEFISRVERATAPGEPGR